MCDAKSWGSMRKVLRSNGVQTSDDVAFINYLIFNQGAIVGDVFAGDNFITAYWGVFVLLNSGGNAIPNGKLWRGHDGTFASFILNARTVTRAVFDRKLFTKRGNGAMIMYNDQWQISHDNTII